MIRTKIYSLRNEIGMVRYIGKTTGAISARLTRHIWDSCKRGSTHRDCWIRSMAAKGLSPVIHLIEEVDGDGSKEESLWILKLRAMNWPLVNLTDGGDGRRGGYVSESTRERLRSVAKLRKPVSEETKRKLSESHKGKIRSKSHCRNLSLANRGKPKFASRKPRANPVSEKHRQSLRGAWAQWRIENQRPPK